jgi:Predicted membrane protein (DUF2207)
VKSWLPICVVFLTVATAHAQERILSYDIDIAVQQSGTLDVTERIKVQAEGTQIRRGIYRDFPTRYKDRYGNRVVVGLEVLGVERDGQPEPWFTENVGNGVRINTGTDDFLPVPAEYMFTLHYRTQRQLGFFADHDELYWNAIGTGWIFAIENASVDVRLPDRVPVGSMSAEAYTGIQGARGRRYATELPDDGVARWRLTAPLAPHEGLTIVLTFPKGVIAAPTGAQRVAWFLRDNRGALIALVGLLMLAGFCTYEWRRVGRDPRKGVIIARYEPPAGQTPAGLRFLRRMGYDTRCFSSAVLSLAVSGCLRIARESKLLKDAWQLERDPSGRQPADEGERTLLDRLFKGGTSSVVLQKSNATKLSAAMTDHNRVLDKAMQPRYFRRNGFSIAKAVLIAVPSVALALVLAQGTGVPAIVVVAVLMLASVIAFALLVRAPTPEGRKLMDEIEGLKLYLSVAERDELARMSAPDQPPQLDAKRYEMLLPYAVALEVEEAWTAKFTAAVGVAAAAATANNMGWYRGGNVGDLGSLSHAIGSSLTSQIASSATPPGSSSGAGGGGSAGGGGGGGGGGGR